MHPIDVLYWLMLLPRSYGYPILMHFLPLVKTGLFHRLILMSGSALSPTTIATEADFHAQSLAKAVNCDTSLDPSLLLECLRTKSVNELNSVNLGSDDPFQTTFGPIVDGLLIPADPRSLMESENSSSQHSLYQHTIGMKSGSSSASKVPSHSLMFGFAKTADAPSILTEHEERNGIDVTRRNRILYDFIKNIIDYYQEVSTWTRQCIESCTSGWRRAVRDTTDRW